MTNYYKKSVEGSSTLDTAELAVENSSANVVTTEADIVSGTDKISDNAPETEDALKEQLREEQLQEPSLETRILMENEEAETLTDYISEEFYKSLPIELQQFLNLYEGRDRDIVFLSIIGVFSSLLPNVRGIYRGEVHFPNLYIQIIAPPASGKGKMKVGLKLFDRLIKRITKDHKDFRIPGNSSSIMVIDKLNKLKGYGNLMFETEADSISGIRKNEWGDFSDILRKAAQHEEIMISRKGDKIDINCDIPRLSMLISGTPSQLAPLINSVDNGLFSRFIFYAFKDITGWGFYSTQPQQEYVMKIVEDFFEGKFLKMLESKTAFRFSDEQQQNFDTFFSEITREILEINPKLLPSVERLGYITFRIMMMLTILEKDDLQENNVISDNAFRSALLLVPTLVEHIIITSTIYGNKVVIADRLTKFLEKLPDEFTLAELKETNNLGSASTIDKNLKLLVEQSKLEKIRQGHYKKV